MKHSMTVLLLTQLLLHLLLQQIPCTVGKHRYMSQKGPDYQTFHAYREPSLEYDQFRRRIKKNIIQFWHLFSPELDRIQKQVGKYIPDLAIRICTIIQLGQQYQRALQSDLEGLKKSDGYSVWREREAAELSELMQLRLNFLQNPSDCAVARKSSAPLYIVEGFWDEMQFLIYRFIISYATNRTMIVHSQGWLSDDSSWEDVFAPFSDTCTDEKGSSHSDWSPTSDAQVVFLPPLSPLLPSAPFFPRSLPADLAPKLEKLHGNPYAWWVGQFFKYIFRPRNMMAKLLEEVFERRKIMKHFVGVYIRRANTIGEAEYIPLEKYMLEVEEYYSSLELTQDVPVRRIYLASDSQKIILDMKKKYRDRYEIYSLSIFVNSTSIRVGSNDITSLMELTLDMLTLSLSDHLVCTFSSSLCRATYEIMQMFHADASDRVNSLESKYFYECELDDNLTAVYPHRAQDPRELNFTVGDEITEVRDLKNGYSFGINMRTSVAGRYPSFKADEILRTFDFPIYLNLTPQRTDSQEIQSSQKHIIIPAT